MEEDMTEFDKSRWAEPEFSREYRDNADVYIVERRTLFEIMKSFYRHFLCNGKQRHVLDLGCGDGILTHYLMELDNSISATLVDLSGDMLDRARERFAGSKNIHYIQASFQDMLEREIVHRRFDFIVSSMAIHHLTTGDKRALFSLIHTHLKSGGSFLNIDVVRAAVDRLESWYMQLWNEWMNEKKTSLGLDRDLFSDIIRRYKELDENKPDTLDDQLNALRETGFQDVDCFYKYGIFAVYGGRKPSEDQ